MPKVSVDPMKLMKVLEKDIQDLESTKSRLIKETNDLQKVVNDLADKKASIDKFLKQKETDLIKKVDALEVEAKDKIKELNIRIAEQSSKNSDLDKAIAENKKAEANHKREADISRATGDANVKIEHTLKEIVKFIKDKLGV